MLILVVELAVSSDFNSFSLLYTLSIFDIVEFIIFLLLFCFHNFSIFDYAFLYLFVCGLKLCDYTNYFISMFYLDVLCMSAVYSRFQKESVIGLFVLETSTGLKVCEADYFFIQCALIFYMSLAFRSFSYQVRLTTPAVMKFMKFGLFAYDFLEQYCLQCYLFFIYLALPWASISLSFCTSLSIFLTQFNLSTGLRSSTIFDPTCSYFLFLTTFPSVLQTCSFLTFSLCPSILLSILPPVTPLYLSYRFLGTLDSDLMKAPIVSSSCTLLRCVDACDRISFPRLRICSIDSSSQDWLWRWLAWCDLRVRRVAQNWSMRGLRPLESGIINNFSSS